MSNVGVHASHCCVHHGCKYGDPMCPVVNEEVPQLCACEVCDWEKNDWEFLEKALLENTIITQAREIESLKLKIQEMHNAPTS